VCEGLAGNSEDGSYSFSLYSFLQLFSTWCFHLALMFAPLTCGSRADNTGTKPEDQENLSNPGA
jgi:hypothetical protein